jgi:hypothetical protein
VLLFVADENGSGAMASDAPSMEVVVAGKNNDKLFELVCAGAEPAKMPNDKRTTPITNTTRFIAYPPKNPSLVRP